MKAKDFIEKRIVLKDCKFPQLNGKTCIVRNAYNNGPNEIVLSLDLPHPLNPKTYLTITADQVAYYKKFSHWIAQYRKPNGETLNNSSLNVFHSDVLDGCQLVGGFDVYHKIVP